MDIITKMLEQIKLPDMTPVRQTFDHRHVRDVETELKQELVEKQIEKQLKPGMRVAITAGSRGIRNIVPILKMLVDVIRESGAKPFIVPAMGSHGGATAEGQCKVLE